MAWREIQKIAWRSLGPRWAEVPGDEWLLTKSHGPRVGDGFDSVYNIIDEDPDTIASAKGHRDRDWSATVRRADRSVEILVYRGSIHDAYRVCVHDNNSRQN